MNPDGPAPLTSPKAEPPPDGLSLFRPRNFAIGFAVLVALWFQRVLFGGESFVLRDFSVFGYPLAHYHRQAFWSGELPLWNPLSSAGMPWLAQWNTLTLYPGSLLYLLPPMPWSLNFYCLAHLYLAGIGMYFLARQWTGNDAAGAFAAVGYALSGLVQNCLMWPNNIAAFAWLPLVLLTLPPALHQGGRPLLLAILVGSLQMLTGAPEIILLTWFGVAAMALVIAAEDRRALARMILLVVGITAVCAIQLLPFIDLLRFSARANSDGQSVWELGPLGWINLFMPLFETRSKATGAIYHATQAWTHSLYLGLVVIWLAGIGLLSLPRGRRLICGLGLLATLLLAGTMDGGLITAVPPFNMIRYPVKFMTFWVVALPLLAGFGTTALRKPTVPTSYSIGALLFLAAIGAAFVRQLETGQIPPPVVLANFGWRVLAAGVTIGLLLKGFSASRSPNAKLIAGALAVFCLDLLTHQPNLHPSINARWFTEPNPAMENFNATVRAGQRRVHPVLSRQLQFGYSTDASLQETFLLTRVSMGMNWNLVEGIAKANGFHSLWSAPQGDVSKALLYDAQDIPVGLADFLGIEHLSSSENDFEWPRRDTALPLVTVGRTPRFGDLAAVRSAVLSQDFDPRTTVWLPTNSVEQLGSIKAVSATVTNLAVPNDEISFQTDSPAPAIATIAVSHFPAWQARIDGEATAIHRANHGFMAIRVPKGKHQVELRYEDHSFAIGRWITLAALIAIAVAWRKTGGQALPPKET